MSICTKYRNPFATLTNANKYLKPPDNKMGLKEFYVSRPKTNRRTLSSFLKSSPCSQSKMQGRAIPPLSIDDDTCQRHYSYLYLPEHPQLFANSKLALDSLHHAIAHQAAIEGLVHSFKGHNLSCCLHVHKPCQNCRMYQVQVSIHFPDHYTEVVANKTTPQTLAHHMMPQVNIQI